jgi:CRP/FNR family transcriptional regulator
MVSSIQFDITIEAEKDAELWIVPAATYKSLMEESAVLANYTNQIMAERFTEVMWLIEQIMWKSFDKRLAQFLTEEAALEDSDRITITHERIANHMGTAREVVTRMLRYFQSEGMVRVSRGEIRLLDEKRLRALAE